MKSFVVSVLFHFSMANKFNQKKSRQMFSRKQSGQSLIVILAFSAILGAGLLSIYSTAQLTITKRELINAADASAYSGATIIAQGLNYTASTNRAILANNALVGQMMAIRSTLSMSEWYWKNNNKMWAGIEAVAQFIPFAGPVITALAGGLRGFGEGWVRGAVHPMKLLAQALQMSGTAAIGVANHALWASQQLLLADSLVGFEPNMVSIAKSNAPLAKVDPLLHSTAFGPIVTLGTVAANFKMKLRSRKYTLIDENDNAKDEYLNYLTETNRNVATPAYLGGRSLLPNAVGLWMTAGCGEEDNYAKSAFLSPPAGLGAAGDGAIRVLKAAGAILGPFGSKIMCMYERHGGSELVQLADGRMAWLSVDVMNVSLPFPNSEDVKFNDRPMAGGATMSFTERTPQLYAAPEAVLNFKKHVTEQRNAGKYLGHQVALPADCVEYLMPGSTANMIAVSYNMRTSGPCAVLATGFEDRAVNKGLWAGRLERVTTRTIESITMPESADAIRALWETTIAPALNGVTANIENAVSNANPLNITNAEAVGGVSPPGISSSTGAGATGTPNVTAATTAGSRLSNWSSGIKNSSKALASGISATIFKINAGKVMETAVNSVITEGEDGDGIGLVARKILRDLGMEGLIDFFQMQVSDGVEKPEGQVNKMFNVLSDGLPPWFWDVRVIGKTQGATAGEEEDLVSSDANPDNYNERRYNNGPVVYLPLVQKPPSIKVHVVSSSADGEQVLGKYVKDELKDLKALGKARIFFRQPSDHWMNRYKVVVNKSLLLPYWQVRNETLSYAEKWLLVAHDADNKLFPFAK